MDNNSKSNRAQADYFELLVCQHICHLYNITFSYSQDLAILMRKVLKTPSGVQRLKIQNDNFIKIQPKIKEILDFEITQKGKIIDVLWVGRKLLIETTSDVDAKHTNNKNTRFSIKSIAKTGTGTLKNLGARQIKKYLNVDFSKEYNQMWEELRNYLNDHTSSQDQIKHKVREDQELLNWATINGKKYQIILNKKCIEGFNLLPLNKKIEYLNYITDCNDEDLYVVIVNLSSVIIYKPIEKNLNLIKKIEVDNNERTDVGYIVCIDGNPTYRVQTNNTNGIGISAFCQRIFWI